MYVTEAIAQIEGFQPYRYEGQPLLSPLVVLQELANTDKHRLLTVSLAEIALGDIVIGATAGLDFEHATLLAKPGTIIDDGTPLYRVPSLPNTKPVVHEVVYTPRIGFLVGKLGLIRPAQATALCERIAEVVDAFASFFPDVDWQARLDSWRTPDP